jgi:Zn-dependent protease with chaperone function
MSRHTFALRTLALLLAGLMALPPALMAKGEPVWPDPGIVPDVTQQQQKQVGLTAMGEVYRKMPVLADSSSLSQYVQQLGRKLQAGIPRQHSWPYRFHVIPQKEVNAFALPGGPIFVTTGTILATGNEAELAGVLAHQMAHVYMQHYMKQQRRDVLPAILADAGAMLGGMIGGLSGAATQALSQTGTGTVIMPYSPADEAQADTVATIMLYKAGYNPQALAEFFLKLEQQKDRPLQFLGDHPNPGNREAAIQNAIEEWPKKSWLENSSPFAAAQEQAKTLRVYTAQDIDKGAKQGIWARQNDKLGILPASVPPPPGAVAAPSALSPHRVRASGTFAQLQRPEYRISYPDNWQILGEHQSNSATIVPAGGFTQSAIAYGVVISQFSPPKANESLDQGMADLIQSVKEQSPELQTGGSPREITVGALRGRSVDLMGGSPVQQNSKAQAEHDWLVAVPQSSGGLLYLVFISPEPDFARLRPTFERMLRSLHLQ